MCGVELKLETMKVTSKQFIKAKRKVFVEFVGFEIVGSILIAFLLWIAGSIMSWDTCIGNWNSIARMLYIVLLVCGWVAFNSILVKHTDGCYQGLKEVKSIQGLDEWCIRYGFRFIN